MMMATTPSVNASSRPLVIANLRISRRARRLYRHLPLSPMRTVPLPRPSRLAVVNDAGALGKLRTFHALQAMADLGPTKVGAHVACLADEPAVPLKGVLSAREPSVDARHQHLAL